MKLRTLINQLLHRKTYERGGFIEHALSDIEAMPVPPLFPMCNMIPCQTVKIDLMLPPDMIKAVNADGATAVTLTGIQIEQ